MTRDDYWLNDVASMRILGPRGRQEDSALHVRLGRGRLIVVADGMGGEPAGDIASMADAPGRARRAQSYASHQRWCLGGFDPTAPRKEFLFESFCSSQLNSMP